MTYFISPYFIRGDELGLQERIVPLWFELEVTRVHGHVCVVEDHSQGRAWPRCWGTCLALDAVGSKGRRRGLAICYLEIHARNNVVIGCAPVKSSVWELMVSCSVGFVLWFEFFFNSTLEWGSYITSVSAHPHQQRWHSYRVRRANQGCCLPRN